MKAGTGMCPACDRTCKLKSQSFLLHAEAAWFKRQCDWFVQHRVEWKAGDPLSPVADVMRRLANSGASNWYWACDNCIRKGVALPADVAVQNLSMGTPFAAYIDRPFRCEDCGRPAIFTATEQRYWYETQRFLIWSHAKQCAPCRGKRRKRKALQKRLAELLTSVAVHEPDTMERISALYHELGSSEKAEVFAARARKARTRNR